MLAAYMVVRSDRHYLRRLDDGAFRSLAKACDAFSAASTGALFVVALFLLPATIGQVLLVIASVWGTALLLTVGRPLALERRRRRRSP